MRSTMATPRPTAASRLEPVRSETADGSDVLRCTLCRWGTEYTPKRTDTSATVRPRSSASIYIGVIMLY